MNSKARSSYSPKFGFIGYNGSIFFYKVEVEWLEERLYGEGDVVLRILYSNKKGVNIEFCLLLTVNNA